MAGAQRRQPENLAATPKCLSPVNVISITTLASGFPQTNRLAVRT
jgi:hypothetical protein